MGQANFYVRFQTRQKLIDESQPKVLLIGGFSGSWNFGDLLQLHGALHWHQQRNANAILCPLHTLRRVSSLDYLDTLRQVFGTDDWLFWAGDEQDTDQSQPLGLEPLRHGIRGPVTIHVYGGGFFNSFWGEQVLTRLEALLTETISSHYIMSGQQIGAEFAPYLADHCRRYRPELIGCRDPISVDLMHEHGVAAQLSGDDALEELMAIAQAGEKPVTDTSPTFGLHLSSSPYVFAASTDQEMVKGKQALRKEINAGLILLARRYGPNTIPILISAYQSDRPEIRETPETIQDTHFSRYFPRHTLLDLVELFANGRLAEAVRSLRHCRLMIATSYHVTLLAKTLGIPAFHLTYSAYYRQKKHGLDSHVASLQEFLTGDLQRIAAKDQEYIQQQRKLRQTWLETLDKTLSMPAPESIVLARASAALDALRSRQVEAQGKLDISVENVKALQQAQQRVERLERQLNRLLSSRSWRLTAPLRNMGAALRRMHRHL